MMSDPGGLALVSLLLPAISFLILAIVSPLRKSGRPAAYMSILFAAGSLAAAVLARGGGHAGGQSRRLVWEWLPSDGMSLATVGILADRDSTLMLILVALVAFLVQRVLARVSARRAAGRRSGATTPITRCSRSR